jgi:hypothetical protein
MPCIMCVWAETCPMHGCLLASAHVHAGLPCILCVWAATCPMHGCLLASSHVPAILPCILCVWAETCPMHGCLLASAHVPAILPCIMCVWAATCPMPAACLHLRMCLPSCLASCVCGLEHAPCVLHLHSCVSFCHVAPLLPASASVLPALYGGLTLAEGPSLGWHSPACLYWESTPDLGTPPP